jgi:hypothetical protein
MAMGGYFKSLLQTFPEANCNPTHGNGWILQIPSTDISLKPIVIPPMAMGGYFKSLLQRT